MEETVGAAGTCVLVAIVTVVVVALIVDGDDSAKVNNGQPDATAPVLVVPTQLPSSRDGYVRKPSSTADDDESFQSLSTDDAYNDGYGCGYEQGCDDGANGHSYGYGYDDHNDYDDYNEYSYQLSASYCQGYADGYDDGYSECKKDG